VSVNAPAAGKITELLVSEEDTVTVGQDLFRFAPGEGGESPAAPSSAASSSEAAPQADSGKPEAKQEAPSPSPPPPSRKAEVKETSNTAAFLTTFNEIDMSSLMEMRKRYKDEVLKQQEVKLGFMSAFARACTLALKEIPAANASIEVRVVFAVGGGFC
jgi:2-oxoglutarate dehydrogenase E2 component (dihydrolipoamide succinyltransferase)